MAHTVWATVPYTNTFPFHDLSDALCTLQVFTFWKLMRLFEFIRKQKRTRTGFAIRKSDSKNAYQKNQISIVRIRQKACFLPYIYSDWDLITQKDGG